MPASPFYGARGVKELIGSEKCLRQALFEELHGAAALSCKELQAALGSEDSSLHKVARCVSIFVTFVLPSSTASSR